MRTLGSRLWLNVAKNQRYSERFVQRLIYAYNRQPHRSANVPLLSMTLTWKPPRPVTTNSPAPRPTDPATAMTPRALRKRLSAQLASRSTKVSGKLHNSKRWYRHFFDRKNRTLSKLHIRRMVYIDRPPFDTLSTDGNTDNDDELLSKAYRSFLFLDKT